MIIENKLLLTRDLFKPTFKDWNIEGVLNPGAIRTTNKKIVLFIRVSEKPNIMENEYIEAKPGKKFSYKIDSIPISDIKYITGNMILMRNGNHRLSNISHIRKVVLDKTGLRIEKIDNKPIIFPTEEYETFGVEDPRITKVARKFFMTYVSVSKEGITTSLAESKDLKKWEKKGMIFSHENKDVVLLPEKIKGEYVALNRPNGNFNFENPSVWISYSKDLLEWGKPKEIFSCRNNSWDSHRIGSGTPPIRTKKGWLVIYHGVSNDKTYSAGAVLLDLKNPSKILARSPIDKPLLIPSLEYERQGFVNNVVFPTGIVEDIDKKSVLIYSGAGDKAITVKKILLKDIIDSLEKI